MPGAHKIGAAISGPRITGGNFMDITFFLRKQRFKNAFEIVFENCGCKAVKMCR